MNSLIGENEKYRKYFHEGAGLKNIYPNLYLVYFLNLLL